MIIGSSIEIWESGNLKAEGASKMLVEGLGPYLAKTNIEDYFFASYLDCDCIFISKMFQQVI
jgi:hypothetical protein